MILESIGMAMIGFSIINGAYELIPKNKRIIRRAANKLNKAFVNGELYKPVKRGKKTYKQYPNIIAGSYKENTVTLIFSVPKGMKPDRFKENEYTFRQHLGKYISLKMEDNRGIVQISTIGLPNKIVYNYVNVKTNLTNKRIPIICGQGINGKLQTFDMAKNPHILIAGETGSGKSSQLRSILTTLIMNKSPNELQLILGDLKRSEFHLFKNIQHVEGVYHSATELVTPLKKVRREMTKRGNLLDEQEVNSIDELKEKLPYIVVCIDEVVLLKKETNIMDILEEISSIGRSLGVFVILSMQRPDADVLDGKLKVNLTVRMALKTADSINAKVIGVEGAERLDVQGRMLMKVSSDIEQIQCTWLSNDKAKQLLKPYKINPKQDKPTIIDEPKDHSNVLELFQNE